MVSTRIQDYAKQYAGQSIRFTPYALKKTGLVQSQVSLKMEDYYLICAPYEISMTRGVFLVVLSPQEISFFQQFQKKMCSINLTFQKTAAKKPLTLLIRATLDRVGPVKGRQNVCMMDTTLKSCPNDLVETIGDFLVASTGLKSQYALFQEKQIHLDEANAKLMRYNNYMELVIGHAKTRATLLALSVNGAMIRPPVALPGMEVGAACSARLYFQIYQFSVNGKISRIDKDSAGRSVVTMSIDFAPELIEIVDDYFYRLSLQSKGGDSHAG
jgi:hypothetical protein